MRIRITFAKSGPMQYVGHLDLHRSWERTFRRAGLPLAYSKGFHPQPRLNLACALSVGFTSQCELLDAWLEQAVPLAQVQQAISTALPPGIACIAVVSVDEHAPALQTQVASAIYLVTFLDEIPDLNNRLDMLKAAEHLPRIRHEKPYDLRPLIETITLVPKNNRMPIGLRIQLATRQGATGRPEELLDELGIKFEDTRVHREKIILTTD